MKPVKRFKCFTFYRQFSLTSVTRWAAIIEALGCKLVDEQQVECTVLAEFKMSKQEEHPEEELLKQ